MVNESEPLVGLDSFLLLFLVEERGNGFEA